MKSLLSSVCIVGALLLTVGGCSTISEPQPDFEQQESTFDQAAIKKGLSMLEAYCDNDPGKFVNMLPEALIKQFGEEEFSESRKVLEDSLGEVKQFEFLTKLNAPEFQVYIFRVTFLRTGVMDKEKEIEQETLFRIIAGDLEGDPQIISFGFL